MEVSQKDVNAVLDYLSRIAHAVETLAKKADPSFITAQERKLEELLKNPAIKR